MNTFSFLTAIHFVLLFYVSNNLQANKLFSISADDNINVSATSSQQADYIALRALCVRCTIIVQDSLEREYSAPTIL